MSEHLGGATTLYICPQCGSPDLMTESSSLLLAAKERRSICPNCQWVGTLADAAGIATTEKVYDTKAILDLLLHVVTKHAAGPVTQVFELVGLLDRDDLAGRNKILRAATEGLIREAFVAAAENAAERSTPMEKHGAVVPDSGPKKVATKKRKR